MTIQPRPELSAAAERLRAWLFDAALPLWWAQGYDHEGGGWQELLGLDGKPAPSDRRARVQGRQGYVYASAGALGWNGPWREAVEQGLAAFLGRYGRPDGLVRTKVSADGAVVDDDPYVYDQAFALLALATAAERGLGPGEDRARVIRDRLLAEHCAPAGGLRETGEQPFQSNCHMHTLEACLAWEQAGGDAGWTALADEIAELALTRWIDADGGFIREFFDADWRPAAGQDGRIVEPGHQFEWSWLLTRWARLRGRDDALAAARRLFEIGRAHGIRPDGWAATDQLLDDLSPLTPTSRLWPQTEWIKAALANGDAAEALRAVAALEAYLDVPTPGLWRDKLRVDGSFVAEPAPASSFYHIVCAIQELLSAAR